MTVLSKFNWKKDDYKDKWTQDRLMSPKYKYDKIYREKIEKGNPQNGTVHRSSKYHLRA